MMVGIGKEYGFQVDFDMPGLFTPHKTELRRKTELQPIKSLNCVLYGKVEVEQRTHFGDKIATKCNTTLLPLQSFDLRIPSSQI